MTKRTILSKFSLFIFLSVGIIIMGCQQNKVSEKPFQSNWSSLKKHSTPQWLEDAKFGIYCHWGVSTVRNLAGNRKKTLEELLPLFTAENFNAAEWADLFKAAGAKFAGPVAWHGSRFVHWDSDLTEWNSADKGTGIDIVGLLEKEIKKRDMKFIISYHSGYESSWLALAKEGVDKYKPDIFWVDAGFSGTKRAHGRGHYTKGKLGDSEEYDLGGVPEKHQQKFLSYYFNQSLKWGREVEFVYKVYDIPPGIGMRDIENGILNGLAYDVWMTDLDLNVYPESRGNWFYNEEYGFKSANYIVDMLVDVVSKNGIMLLNVPPKADGSFSDQAKEILFEIGKWLDMNGEAIYGAMPWLVYGEGPTEIEYVGNHIGHHMDQLSSTHFKAADVRFTVKDEHLYAICLGWPGEKVVIRTLGSRGKLIPDDIKAIEMIGVDKELEYKQDDKGLVVQMPDKKPCEFAYVLKIIRKAD